MTRILVASLFLMGAVFGPVTATTPLTIGATYVNVASLDFAATYTSADLCAQLGSTCPTPNTAAFEAKLNFPGAADLKLQFVVDGVVLPATVTRSSTGIVWGRATEAVKQGSHNVQLQCKRRQSATADVVIDSSTLVALRASAG